MAMEEAITNFPEQFSWQPKVENSGQLEKYQKFIVLGMGGSNLAPDLFKVRDPNLDIISHRNYGLPRIAPDVLKKSLIIASSYSGNTEEVIDGLQEALNKKFPAAVLTTGPATMGGAGGKLLALAKKHSLPYVQMPATGIQPRSALGYATLGLSALMGLEKFTKELRRLAALLDPKNTNRAGRTLAKRMKGRVPVIYSSSANATVAYNWKIKFNETGKIPAFYNVFPELNHNEMTGFDIRRSTRKLSKNFYFIFLRDAADHPKIIRRMKITQRLYRERGLTAELIFLKKIDIFQKIFSSLLLADWAAYYTAKNYGVEPEQVPMVEEFKRSIVE